MTKISLTHKSSSSSGAADEGGEDQYRQGSRLLVWLLSNIEKCIYQNLS